MECGYMNTAIVLYDNKSLYNLIMSTFNLICDCGIFIVSAGYMGYIYGYKRKHIKEFEHISEGINILYQQNQKLSEILKRIENFEDGDISIIESDEDLKVKCITLCNDSIDSNGISMKTAKGYKRNIENVINNCDEDKLEMIVEFFKEKGKNKEQVDNWIYDEVVYSTEHNKKASVRAALLKAFTLN